jgi:hypothetical protein
VYIDTVPPAMNAVLTVTVGSIALFMDGGGTLADSGGACGGTLHFFVLALIAASFALLGLLSYVIMGYRVSIDINMPFQALVGIVSALGVIWFFFGLPVFLVWVVQLVTAAGAMPPCFRLQPLLFGAQPGRARARAAAPLFLTLFSLFPAGFVMFELVVIPILVSVLLTKWGIVSFVNSVRAFFQQLLGLCCRKRVAVTEADSFIDSMSFCKTGLIAHGYEVSTAAGVVMRDSLNILFCSQVSRFLFFQRF